MIAARQVTGFFTATIESASIAPLIDHCTGPLPYRP
jgi:hypothetical protein